MAIKLITGLVGSGKTEYIIKKYNESIQDSILLCFAYEENNNETHCVHSKNLSLDKYYVKTIKTVQDLVQNEVFKYKNIFIESLHKISDVDILNNILSFLIMLSNDNINIYISLYPNSNNKPYVHMNILDKYNIEIINLESSCYVCGSKATTSKDVCHDDSFGNSYEYVYNVCDKCYDSIVDIDSIINLNLNMFSNSPYHIMKAGDRI